MRAAYGIRARAARRLLDAPAPVHRTSGDESLPDARRQLLEGAAALDAR